MSYTSPAADRVNFELSSGYTAPAAATVDFGLGETDSQAATPSPVPGVISIVQALHANAVRRQNSKRFPHNTPSIVDHRIVAQWHVPMHADRIRLASWSQSKKQYSKAIGTWRAAEHKTAKPVEAPYTSLEPVDPAYASVWDGSIESRDKTAAAPYRYPPTKDRENIESWHHVDANGNPYEAIERYAAPSGSGVYFDLKSGYSVPGAEVADFSLGTITPVRAIQPRQCLRSMSWAIIGAEGRRDNTHSFPWGPGRSDWRVDPVVIVHYPTEITIIRPPEPLILETYSLMPSLEIVRLPDRAPVVANEITLRSDLDSWAWSVSFTPATRDDLDLVRVSTSGAQEVEITVNGYRFTAVIEGYEIDRKFGSTGFSVQGRSLTAYLAAPYAPARSATQENPRNALQLIDEELVNTDFTSDYQAQDWLIPGGVWSYTDLTPIQVIQRIAQASGAVIQSDVAEKTLHLVTSQ